MGQPCLWYPADPNYKPRHACESNCSHVNRRWSRFAWSFWFRCLAVDRTSPRSSSLTVIVCVLTVSAYQLAFSSWLLAPDNNFRWNTVVASSFQLKKYCRHSSLFILDVAYKDNVQLRSSFKNKCSSLLIPDCAYKENVQITKKQLKAGVLDLRQLLDRLFPLAMLPQLR